MNYHTVGDLPPLREATLVVAEAGAEGWCGRGRGRGGGERGSFWGILVPLGYVGVFSVDAKGRLEKGEKMGRRNRREIWEEGEGRKEEKKEGLKEDGEKG